MALQLPANENEQLINNRLAVTFVSVARDKLLLAKAKVICSSYRKKFKPELQKSRVRPHSHGYNRAVNI